MARFTNSNRHARAATAVAASPKKTPPTALVADAAMDVIFGEFRVFPSSG